MIEVQQIFPRLYQTILDVRAYVTQNSWGQHSNLKPGEYRKILNYELYDGFIKSRRGSQFLRPSTMPLKLPVERVLEVESWDVGATEYLIYMQVDKWYAMEVSPSALNPVLINGFDGLPYTQGLPGNDTVPDISRDGGRMYSFHPRGNSVIDWFPDEGVFKIRDMGMKYPTIANVTGVAGGDLVGLYTYGIEKVYQRDSGGDHLASSPNRYMTDRLIATLGFIQVLNPVYGRIEVDPVDLENDTLWTHVRLWRSTNQRTYLDGAENVIATGVPNELYEIALITRDEMLNPLETAIATSNDNELPAGNEHTTAGQPGGVGTNFVLTDNSVDAYLSFLIAEDSLELLPLPNSWLGVAHQGQIFISRLDTNTLADGSQIDEDRQEGVFYANDSDLARGEQFKAENYVSVPLDGQKMTKLITFEKELFMFKEAKTMRLQNGDVTLPVEVLDQRIGTSDKGNLAFVPTLGICGKTNDYGDFRILGFDFVWRSTFNGIEISKPIRDEMNNLYDGEVNILYINGKVFVNNNRGTCYILNVEQGLGWSEFQYLTNNSNRLFHFSNNSRGGIIGGGEYLIEFEVEDLDFDVDIRGNPEFEGANIDTQFITSMFRSQDGSDVLEHEWLSIMAKVDNTITAIPYVNEVSWPDPNIGELTDFVLDPSLFSAIEKLNDREHRLFIEPAPQGIFLFNRMIGNFLHYDIRTVAPCIFKAQRLHVIVDEDGLAWGNFDPFQIIPEEVIVNDIIETGTAGDTYTESGASPDIIQENN